MGVWANGGFGIGLASGHTESWGTFVSVRGSVGSMVAATLVSRALGFLKAILLVAAIGVTSAGVGGQAFENANSAPTYLFALIAGGVLGAVLVPQIVRNLHDGTVGQDNTDRLLTIVLFGGAVATVVLTLCAPGIVWIYATNWSSEWRGLATSMAYWCLPQIFFLIAFAVLSQVLNARGVYGAPAWAPAISNLVGIGGIVVFLLVLPSGVGDVDSWSPVMIAVLSGTATLAIALQSVLLVVPSARPGFGFGFDGVSAVWGRCRPRPAGHSSAWSPAKSPTWSPPTSPTAPARHSIGWASTGRA